MSTSTSYCSSRLLDPKKRRSARNWLDSASRQESFYFKALSPEQKAAVVEGMKAGEAKVDQYAVSKRAKDINGWRISSILMVIVRSSMAIG